MENKQMQIPLNTQKKILEILKRDFRIPTEQMLNLVAKDVGADLSDRMVRAFWLDKCQRLMAGIRDEDGQRMIFNIPKGKSKNGRSEYILVDACEDDKELKIIKHRLRSNISGMRNSVKIIDLRLGVIKRLRMQIDKAISGIRRKSA